MRLEFTTRPRLASIVGLLIALKLLFLFTFAVHGRFVMDEFVQLGWAKYLGHGLFDTIWPAKAVGYAVFYKAAHLIGWDARSILIAGRLQTALLGCVTIAMLYAIARSLGSDRLRALAIVLVLLSFSNFIERIYRTIAEPLALFFAVAALLVIVRRSAEHPGRLIAAGALCGLSFLATQKAIYFDVALGIALVGEAVLGGRPRAGLERGWWLVLGWCMPVAIYCLAFGGGDALAVGRNLILGPTVIAGRGAGDYGGLRQFVMQSLGRNALVYLFCFAGAALAVLRFRRLSEARRIALIFTLVITVLIFAHDQPWPYVFIMAQPFLALWAIEPIDRLAANPLHARTAAGVLAIGIAVSFVRNIQYEQFGNERQLALVDRAQSLLGPDEVYFDGIGMLPNRREPSTLWIDQHYVLKTLREGRNSEAYRILAQSPPKLIIWSYRMDAIEPVIGPLVRRSYVQVAPNIRLAGAHLVSGKTAVFVAPVAGTYGWYDLSGRRLALPPVTLPKGSAELRLPSGPSEALLLPLGRYAGKFASGDDDADLFAGVYS